ncbi:hypothetical protein D3C78_1529850 [compost metagenome]
MACLPRITSCGCSLSTTALSNLATASGPSSSLLSTSTARSAPRASAVRSCSWAALLPMLTTTTSLAMPFSLRRTASSTAISQKGFIAILTLARSTPELSALTRTLTL